MTMRWTAQEHKGKVKCFLNGEDVTDRAFDVTVKPNGRGTVWMYEEPVRVWKEKICTESRYGQIEVIPHG